MQSTYPFLFLYGQAESEATLKEMRSLRERVNTTERAAEGLKSDLSAMVAQRDHGQAELHQARLQAAQLTLQLADSSLALREGRACWSQERQNLQRTAEVNRGAVVENLGNSNISGLWYSKSFELQSRYLSDVVRCHDASKQHLMVLRCIVHI